MIQHFKLLRENSDIDMPLPDSDISILMTEVVACFQALKEGSEGCTVISLKSGEEFVLRILYEEFLSVWTTCTEQIDI